MGLVAFPRTAIDHQANHLKVGEAFKVDSRDMFDAYPARSPFEHGGGIQGAIDRFLSNVIGSAYGSIRCVIDPLNGRITISRHEPDAEAVHCGFVHHVDPDRQWMFDRVPGGWTRTPPNAGSPGPGMPSNPSNPTKEKA